MTTSVKLSCIQATARVVTDLLSDGNIQAAEEHVRVLSRVLRRGISDERQGEGVSGFGLGG
jgi:hypothetical protein